MGLKFKKLAFQKNKFQLVWMPFAHPNQSLNPNYLNWRLRQNESDFVYCICLTSFGFKSDIFAYFDSFMSEIHARAKIFASWIVNKEK